MTKTEAKQELLKNINCSMSHAVLLHGVNAYRTELHSGFASNCLCDGHHEFIWREDGPYTDPIEVADL